MDGTHNMLTLKFNPWYNNLDYIKELMGGDLAKVVVEYDKNIMISLLMKANQFTSCRLYFDARMLIEESIKNLIVFELLMFDMLLW